MVRGATEAIQGGPLLDTQAQKMDNVKNSAKDAQTALHNYAAGSPYNATVNTTVGADE